jgi:hypothetical protein
MSDERAEMARYLAANPGRTARDFKGKGRIRLEPPRKMTEADELRRYLARNPGKTARDFKGKGYRPDPWHDWAPPSLTSADRLAATPAPSPVAGEADGEGARKVRGGPSSRPAAATIKNANTENRERDDA